MGSILVIYGDEAVRQTIGKILELDSHFVALAADGEHGLPKLRQQNFDLVICDVEDNSASMTQLLQLCDDKSMISILESSDVVGARSDTMQTLLKPFEGADLLFLVRKLIKSE
jgi:DNA-binding NtrC family response regulator